MVEQLNVGIVVDGGTDIGLGHVYRCLEIACQLEKTQYVCQIVFITSSEAVEALVGQTYPVVKLASASAKQYESDFRDILKSFKINIVLFDLLEDSLKKHCFLIKRGNRIIASISTFQYKFERFEDLTFYPCMNRTEQQTITGVNGKSVAWFQGPEYLIIRREFCDTPRQPVRKLAHRVLITMGGSDPHLFTEKVIEAIELVPMQLECTVIAGRSFMRQKQIQKLTGDSKHQYTILSQVEEMAKLMQQHDIAVINGGLTRYEAVVAGMPFIAISIHDLQFSITDDVTVHGVGINLGVGEYLSFEEIAHAVSDLLLDYQRRVHIRENSVGLLDCNGGARIAGKLITYGRSEL